MDFFFFDSVTKDSSGVNFRLLDGVSLAEEDICGRTDRRGLSNLEVLVLSTNHTHHLTYMLCVVFAGLGALVRNKERKCSG